jgi:hypothetical protein
MSLRDKNMRIVLVSLWVGFCCLFSSIEASAQKLTPFCDIAQNDKSLENRMVVTTALAKAGSHPYEISLTGQSCSDESIFVFADPVFEKNKNFMRLLSTLYPGYPNGDADLDARVSVFVTGKLVLRKYQGVLARVLELGSITLKEQK